MFRRRGFRRFRRFGRAPGTSLRWVASLNITTDFTAAAGSASAFDLTPGAPAAQWQSGTTEPTLMRIRGLWWGLPLSAVAVSSGGVREQRVIAVALVWRKAGETTLDPTSSADMSSEDVLWHDALVLDTRDFVVPASAAPANPAFVNIAGPGTISRPIDVRARRRVRSENDRLQLVARGFEVWTQSEAPGGVQQASISARVSWALRFLYRTHR